MKKMKKIIIDRIPPQVAIQDINKNGCLLNDEQKEIVKNKCAEDGHYEKAKTGVGYAILTKGGEHFVIYKGKDHKVGIGVYASVKLAQHLESGIWSAIKISPRDLSIEVGNLKKYNKLTLTTSGHDIFTQRSSKKHQSDVQEFIMKLAPGVALHQDSEVKNYLSKTCLALQYEACINILQELKKFYDNKEQHGDFAARNMVLDPSSGKINLIDLHDAGVMGSAGAYKYAPYRYIEMAWVRVGLAYQFPSLVHPEKEKIEKNDIAYINKWIEFYQAQINHLPIEDKTVRVCVLPFNAIAQRESDESLIRKLKPYNYVWLIDTSLDTSGLDYVKARHFLEGNGIYLENNTVFQVENDKSIDWENLQVLQFFFSETRNGFHYKIVDALTKGVLAETPISRLAASMKSSSV